jgi:hypothetical protein
MARGICGTRGTEKVVGNLFAWVKGADKMAENAMERFGQKCEEYCKTRHPWKNDTGLAEAFLGHTTIRHTGMMGGTTTEIISHGVEWGVYLELRSDFHGKYKILDESIQANMPGLMANLKAIFLGTGAPGITTTGVS